MKGYGQFCPIAKASEVLGERWTNLVIRELIAGGETFTELRKALPLISPSLLSARLKSLEDAGVVERNDSGKHVTYALTESGRELKPIIMQLGVWGHRWVRSDLSKQDLDPSVLMWDIHRNIDADFFTAPLTVLLFEFSDYTSKFRRWWLVIKQGDVDICLKDPGHDIDLHVATDLKTLTGMWMGDVTLGHALRSKLIVVTGSAELKRSMSKWLGTNYYADVKAAR